MLLAALGTVFALSGAASPAQADAYWRTCSPPRAILGTMLTHQVGCAQARKVIRKVFVKSQTTQGTNRLRARGFTCRLRPYAARAIRCKRGEQRILSPLAG
jgi:hypothetical protein